MRYKRRTQKRRRAVPPVWTNYPPPPVGSDFPYIVMSEAGYGMKVWPGFDDTGKVTLAWLKVPPK